jgi:putative addiction module component (TIGR02574 family)
MSVETILEAFRALAPEDRRIVADAINEEMEGEPFELTEEVRRMLDERIAAREANPNSGVPFEEVVREARARWGR